MAMTADIIRHLRLRCWLDFGAHELAGYTVTIGALSAHVRTDAIVTEDTTLSSQRGVKVRVHMPEDEILLLDAEVTWVRKDEHDFSGAQVTGVGLAWLAPSPRTRERLLSLVASYKHAVLVVSADENLQQRMNALFATHYDLNDAVDLPTAQQAFGQRTPAVLIVGPDMSAQDLKALAALCSISHTVPLVLGSQVERLESEFLDLGRWFFSIGRPLQDDVLHQVVFRSVVEHDLAVENERLNIEVDRSNRRLKRENAYLRKRLIGPKGYEGIIGSSPALLKSLGEIQRVVRTDATVHIAGETGTGKELFARALHYGSSRASAPFVPQNCAGIPETLVLSTLFGHVKGAFTGAERAANGIFQEANGGTLFLDEIAELPPGAQASLLRALQEREIVPVGATRGIKVDVRIVSATHKDLREEVRVGRFREDLFFRLMVLTLRLPPLRERTTDIALLARHFLDLHCARYGRRIEGFSSEAMQSFERYSWPGNVRELENEVERLVVLAENDTPILVSDLSQHIQSDRPMALTSPTEPSSSEPALTLSLDTPFDQAVTHLETALVSRAMTLMKNNVSRAAKHLAINRTRLIKLRRRLGLE